MTTPTADNRSAQRRLLDEQIADEPKLPPPAIPPGMQPVTLEAHFARRRPIAVNGIVENGLVRPLDPSIQLPENAHVIIVAAEAK
jgi:hypothetical protein